METSMIERDAAEDFTREALAIFPTLCRYRATLALAMLEARENDRQLACEERKQRTSPFRENREK